MLELRPYQLDLINDIKSEIRSGKKSICAVLGCGGGKSVIQGTIAASATAKKNRVLFLVHRKELCEQISNTFKICGVDFDYCSVAMVATVSRRLDKTQEPQLIITDEAHHALAATYKKIYEHYPKALRLGFTATPCRLGTGGLGEVFDSLVEGVSTEWLINNNYLAPYRYYSINLADLTGVRTSRGEYNQADLAEIMQRSKIYGSTVSEYKRLANGKRTIVYLASIKASLMTAYEFAKNGISAAHLDGETPAKKRAETIERFRNGEIDVLCNVDLFGEGFDVPDCECVILVRPTQSLTLHIQQSMRSMRYKPGKEAIIIDLVGNVYRHGLPDDKREWSLESSKKSKEQNKVNVKQCPACMATIPSNVRTCRCGFTFPVEEREELEQLDLEMHEVNSEDFLRLKPYGYYKEIKTFEEMRRFQKAKKYKFAWTIRKCVELGIEIPDKYDEMRWYIGV